MAKEGVVDRPPNYRSPAAVVMKLMNFRSLDTEYSGAGLSAIGRTDRLVWHDLAGNILHLHILAGAIADAYPHLSKLQSPASGGDDVEEAVEGGVLARVHFQRERDARLVKAKKRRVLESTGKLECEVCSFDFYVVYGERGRNYIECHHIKPLFALKAGTKTRLVDLALVCANCHRMLHRAPWPTISDLKIELGGSKKV